MSLGAKILVATKASDILVEQGYELSFRSPKDENPLLVEFDEPKFAHVILLASETNRTWYTALISTNVS